MTSKDILKYKLATSNFDEKKISWFFHSNGVFSSQMFSVKRKECEGFLCLCARLFICALWSPAGKGLTSWLSFVVSNFVTFQLVSRVRCGTWLYRFLIFAPLLNYKTQYIIWTFLHKYFSRRMRPSMYMMSKQRRIDVDATPWRRIDVDLTFF